MQKDKIVSEAGERMKHAMEHAQHEIASARISRARSAAAVSVVKYGLPVPAAKITTRPFSRWRIARRRM